MTVFVFSKQNVFFIQANISVKQILSHQFFYINNIFIQSHEMLVNLFCIQYAEQDFSFFMKCCRVSDHFNDTCTNCKWHDHIIWCFIQNSDRSQCSHNALLLFSSFFLICMISENHWFSDSESWFFLNSILNNIIILT